MHVAESQHSVNALLAPRRRPGCLPMASLARRYAAALDSHPLLTKCTTAASIMAGADMTQQSIEQRGRRFVWDRWRTVRLAGFYFSVHTPFVHFWFARLERIFGAVTPHSDLPRFAAKVATDQAVGPPIVMGLFCLTQPVLNGDGWRGSVEMVRSRWMPMLLACWQLWIPVQCVVFGAVPLKYRILSMNFVSFGWSTCERPPTVLKPGPGFACLSFLPSRARRRVADGRRHAYPAAGAYWRRGAEVTRTARFRFRLICWSVLVRRCSVICVEHFTGARVHAGRARRPPCASPSVVTRGVRRRENRVDAGSSSTSPHDGSTALGARRLRPRLVPITPWRVARGNPRHRREPQAAHARTPNYEQTL